MAKAPNYDSEVLRRVKDRRDPAQTAKTQTRMLIAAKINEQMQKQDVSKSQLANLLEQRPSVVTKWLSGTHNFTLDTLVDISRVLNFDIFKWRVL
jgi:ribosome-binding protein aMBF1 (putative translation factor)